MAKICKVTVHYMDGHKEEYSGGVHVGRDVLQIGPRDSDPVRIPLCNIRKFHITPAGGE